QQTVSLTITAVAADSTSASVSKTIKMIEVNDAVSLSAPSDITFEDTAAVDTFTVATGTLVGSDPDSGTTYIYGISGGTAVSATTVTKTGTYGVLSLNTSSGAYTFTANAGAINALTAATSEEFTVTVNDGSGSSASQTLTVNITSASNEAPVISVESGDAVSANLQEDGTTVLSRTGTLSVSDIDTTDTVIVEVVDVVASGTPVTPTIDNATLLAMLSVDAGDVIANNATSGDLTWSFNSGGEDLSSLADGESFVLTYNIRATDSATNQSSLQTVTINITGASTAPFIRDGDDVALLSETNNALTASGNLTVTDSDTSQTVTVSSTLVASGTIFPADSDAPTQSELEAMLTLTPSSVADASAGETIAWNFNSGSETFDYLADGETLVLTYTLETDDGGLTDTTTVKITITGTNDGPVITNGPDTLDLNETDTTLNGNGTLTVRDLDTTDVVNASVSLVSSDTGTGSNSNPAKPSDAELLAMLSVTPIEILDNTQQQATMSWTFNSDSEAFDYLAAGETLIAVYSIKVTDDAGTALSDSETVTVTITGTNDAPTLALSRSGVTYTDTAANDSFVAASGTLQSTDKDTADSQTFGIFEADPTAVALAGFDVSKTSAYGVMFVNSTSGAYRFVPNTAAINGLSSNTSQTFDLTVNDGTTTSQQTFTVTLVAANDTPEVTGQLTGSVNEGNVGDTTSVTGSLAISDRDAADSPSFADVASTVGDNSYGNFSLSSGTWTYTLNQSAVQNLDAGDSVTDTHTFTATDGTTQVITVTINGTNDAPTLTAPTAISFTDTDGDDTFTNATDTLVDSDVDNDDTELFAIFGHTADSSRNGYDVSKAGRYGTLYLNSSTGAYLYAPSGAAIEAATGTVSEQFSVSVTDSQGASASQTLTVNVMGVNDSTVITAYSAGSDTATLEETNSALSVNGALTVSDLDVAQTVDVSVAEGTKKLNDQAASALTTAELAWLTFASATALNDSQDTSRIEWTFTSANEAFDYLRAGDVLVLSYTARFDDGVT
ncbi:MAG TPA: VCBS domain-containing protein, partial [Pseudomonadales bacterium]|nr:VCBS domain-containing protein [Pseudomonadales bacterium]